MNDIDPIIKVTELAFGMRFYTKDEILCKIVNDLNSEFNEKSFMTGKRYKEIINKNLNDPNYNIPAGTIDNMFGWKSGSFDCRVMWCGDETEGWKAIGKIIVPTMVPLFTL